MTQLPQPEPQPVTPPAPEPTPEPVQEVVAPPSTQAMALHGFLKIIDPEQKGVGLDRVRPMYPKVGWNVILSHCAELESNGLLSKVRVTNANGKGGHEEYTWQ